MDNTIETPRYSIFYGPTASGKTQAALDLAAKQKADILSFDSRQVFTGMDIATGKDVPPKSTKETVIVSEWETTVYTTPTGVKLYGLDVTTPDKEFSISHYYLYVKDLLKNVVKKKKSLILVGGSWQYAHVLIAPPESLFIPPDPELRDFWENEPLEKLQERVRRLAPIRWFSLSDADKANTRRLLRTLEITQWQGMHTRKPPQPILQRGEYTLQLFGTTLEETTPAIEERIEQRLKNGVLEETKKLMELYPDWDTPAFTATGYSFLREHLEGLCTLEEAKAQWLHQERMYAKRQFTWLKSLQERSF